MNELENGEQEHLGEQQAAAQRRREKASSYANNGNGARATAQRIRADKQAWSQLPMRMRHAASDPQSFCC